MFEFNPDLIEQDDDEADEGVIEREMEEKVSFILHYHYNVLSSVRLRLIA